MKRSRPFVFLALMGVFSCTKNPSGVPSKIHDVSAPEFKALAEQKNGLYLDVRTPDEVAQGHIAGATVIDINEARFKQKLALMQKTKPIFVYCASGRRSSSAAKLMNEMGFGEIYNLIDGIKSWKQAGFPIEQGEHNAPLPANALEPAALDALLKKEHKVLIDYQTPWCTPCRKMSPIVDTLTEQWKGRAVVLRVDIDASESLVTREKIEGVPVFVLYVNGQEHWRKSGELAIEELESALNLP